MKFAVWIAVAALVVLHQAPVFTDDHTLLGGFLPVGLAYHAGISLLAAVVWLAAVNLAWPVDEDVEQAIIAEASPESENAEANPLA